MLVLSRRFGERLVINDNITITVIGVESSQVRLGIDAPREVSIHREEVFQRIIKEQEKNALTPSESYPLKSTAG